MSSIPRGPAKPPMTPGYIAPSPIERRPSSPRKFSNPPTPSSPPPRPPLSPSHDPTLARLTSQLTAMQEDIRKRDALIQDLYKQFQSPNNTAPEASVARELADAKREIEALKEST